VAQEFTVKETGEVFEPTPIDGTIEILVEGVVTKVKVGNTGFDFRLIRDAKGNKADLLDFVPEHNFGESLSGLPKHMTILGFSLYEIYRWLKSQSKELEEFKKKGGEIGLVTAHTNHTLIRAIGNLFSKSGHSELVIPDEDDFSVSVDFKGLSELEEDDVLITKLKRYHERAKGYTVLVAKKAG